MREDIDKNLAKAAEGLRSWAALPDVLVVTSTRATTPAAQGDTPFVLRKQTLLADC